MNEQAPHESTPKPEPFDKEWYQEFQQAGGALAAYDYLEGVAVHRDAEQKKFLAGEIDAPTLDYPKLKMEDLQQKDVALVNLKKKILEQQNPADEKIEIVKQVYHWKINEKLAEVRLLKAAAEGDSNRFRRYSEFIYGKPNPDIFSYAVHSLEEKMRAYTQSENPTLQRAAVEYLSMLPTNLSHAEIAELPSTQTFTEARQRTLAELGHLINIPTQENEIKAEEIKSAFTTAIERARLEGWKSVIDPNRKNISVSQEKKTAFVPQERSVKPNELTGLILHEIGTHALRRQNGERSKLVLLGLGLDRYKDDEGVATMREQVGKNKMDDFAGIESYLAISLASGLDGQKKNFQEVFEIMQKHYLVKELANGANEENAQKKAADTAYKLCVRAFRGTDCKTPGVTFNKDLLYYDANIGTWEVIKNNPNEINRFSVGKYDPANSRHIWILEQLGITDQDLNTLETA